MDADLRVTAPFVVDRDKTPPFLVRIFVKNGSFHRVGLFDELSSTPTTDEHQIFTWRDATLREVLTTLREVAPATTEFRHPLARYSFKALYADPAQRGAFTAKDLGMVYSRDILGEPGSAVANTAEDGSALPPAQDEGTGNTKQEGKTLEDLRFMPGDYMLMSIVLPKSAAGPASAGGVGERAGGGGGGSSALGGFSIKGSGSGAGVNGGLGSAGGGGRLEPASSFPPGGLGRGGGHWRARPGIARPVGDRGRDRDREGSPPPNAPRGPADRGRGGDRGRGDRDRGDRDRGGAGGDRGRDPPPGPRRRRSSRSRSPATKRRRYDD